MTEEAGMNESSELRRQAEVLLSEETIDLTHYTPDELLKLVYELRVHQVELELQNEELRQARMKEELIRQNYVDLYDYAPVGYFTLAEDGLILEANFTGSALLGLAKSQIIGRKFSQFVAPEDQDDYYFYFKQLIKSKRFHSDEVRLVKQDGAYFEARLEGQATPPRPDNRQQYRLIINAISEQKQIEESLLNGIISTATDAIISIDAAQRIVLFNAAAEQLFGYKAAVVTGRPLNLLLPERFQAAHRRHVDHFGQTGVTARQMGLMPGELWGRRADGREFPIEATISQVTVVDQKFYTVILRDITERKRIEEEKARLFEAVSDHREELRAMTARLAELQEAERRGLARELHDRVGQNLTTLGLNLNLIRSRLAKTSSGVEPVQAYLDDCQALIEETVARVRDVMTDLRPPVLDDYGLVAALRWHGQRLASRTGLALKVQGAEPNPRLAAPVENALFRIAQEALTNIVKHARATQVTATVETSQTMTRLVIADDGSGFDPAAVARPAGRSGWGLLTMRERAEAAGGRCHIESSSGQGTRIVIEVDRESG